jgi:hypothetical protein
LKQPQSSRAIATISTILMTSPHQTSAHLPAPASPARGGRASHAGFLP